MEKRTFALNNSLSNDVTNITSKLRRLCIQEALILQSVHKSCKSVSGENHNTSSSSYKELYDRVKDSYVNIKNLYDEVKANTQSKELLADIDIDEIKKKVIELDSNIKTIKSEINSKLADLKQTELDINKQFLQNLNEVDTQKRRPKTHIHTVNYNAIVPSPVKAMMTSPFKCMEVQQFQEFMKNSPNRYGGWNEYNHNIFVKKWQTFFGKNYTSEFECETFGQLETFKMFVEDLLSTIRGITATAITAHAQWYLKYISYKEKQQNAIDKWKWSKLGKTIQKKVMYAVKEDSLNAEVLNCDSNTRHHVSTESETKRKRSISKGKRTHTILKPTKQWLNRNQLDNTEIRSSSSLHSIELLEKQLGTPRWRLGLSVNFSPGSLP